MAGGALCLAALILLPVDAFPLGMQVLREFGGRPTNFVLGIAAGLLFASIVNRSTKVTVTPASVWAFFIVGLMIPALNLPVALRQDGADTSLVLSYWMRQYLMLAWGFASYWIWRVVLGSISDRFLALAILVAGSLSVAIFLIDYTGLEPAFEGVLGFLRRNSDYRPAGLASEPSVFASWVGVFWPLTIYVAVVAWKPSVRFVAVVTSAGVLACAYLSNSRTIAVATALQLAYLFYWVLRRQGGALRKLAWCTALAVVGGLFAALLLDRLLSAVDVAGSASSLARFSYTLAGLNVAAEYPLLGVGIGQFPLYFADFVPALARGSVEISQRLAGLSEFRESTFNLFVRLAVEFGIPAGICLGWIAVRPMVQALRRTLDHPLFLWSMLSAVGGICFWLQQDQYGYQPAIFSLALLANVLDRACSRGDRSTAPAVGLTRRVD